MNPSGGSSGRSFDQGSDPPREPNSNDESDFARAASAFRVNSITKCEVQCYVCWKRFHTHCVRLPLQIFRCRDCRKRVSPIFSEPETGASPQPRRLETRNVGTGENSKVKESIIKKKAESNSGQGSSIQGKKSKKKNSNSSINNRKN
ncbi:unnamed protein product [Nezara viridula]|uniref:Uncharacterized protein n=1 Tax=Nezara viridula TaxID=85310 RepID=A0A9P0H3V2_NEZVI|nr:unnamed protein product [Nezara viridula]